MGALVLFPIDHVKAVVDQLYDLGIDPLHLHVDTRTLLDKRPNITMWLPTRTDFETYIAANGWAKKVVEKRYTMPGQREWYVENDTDQRRLLVHCVSFTHHDDWQPRDGQVGQ